MKLLAALCLAAVCGLARAESEAEALNACLAAWAQHPFGSSPVYQRLDGAVTVLNRGPSIRDAVVTDTPSLVLVNPGVNVLGGAKVALLNPNGWYCLRSMVSVLGGMNLQLHCRARLASAAGTATVWGGDHPAPGVTVMGNIAVERVGCQIN